MKTNIRRRITLSVTAAVVIVVIAIGIATIGFAQSPEDATRRLWDTAFIPTGKAPRRRVTRKRSGVNYRIATPNVPTTSVDGNTVVGVTVWRLRRSTSDEMGERLIVHEGSDTVQWLPERISANRKLAEGDRLRISVEAARTGYLYVIDREQYADGSFSEPYLIFPTTRTLNGNNEVKVGRVVEIPAQDDAPPYFKVKRSRSDQMAEVLSVMVTPNPLEGFQIADKPQKLSEAQVAGWEKSWGTQVGLLELENGAGKTWTKEEREAAADPTRALKSGAPAPQVLYYRPRAKAGEPMLVNVRLRY